MFLFHVLKLGDTMNYFYGLGAVVSAMIAVIDPEASPIIQFGALGLCGFMVYFLCNHIKQMHKDHSKERQKLIEETQDIAIKAIECYSMLTNELKQRMCLVKKHHLEKELSDAIAEEEEDGE